MKAIETVYNGILFRSRLETQWAQFFDHLSLQWAYEPEGYTNGRLRYLPDFWLAGVYSRGVPGGVFFEVKPSSPVAGEIDKAVMLAAGSQRPVIVVSKSPTPACREDLFEFVRTPKQDSDDSGLCFARCAACGCCDIGFYGREPRCSCGHDAFSAYDSELDAARSAFPQFGRWSAAA